MTDMSRHICTESALGRAAAFDRAVAEVAKNLILKESRDLRDVLKAVALVLKATWCSASRIDSGRIVADVQDWSVQPLPLSGSVLSEGLDAACFESWYAELRCGRYVLVRDLLTETNLKPDERRLMDEARIRSLVAVPIMANQNTVGLLCVGDSRAREWVADEVGLLVTISGMISAYYRRVDTEARIEYLTYHDSLTRVHNRTYFEAKLLGKIAGVDTLSVIMGDLNGLKLVNDTMGHYEGDRLLVAAAAILKASCRETDTIIRWGGDEFIIVLPDADSQMAAGVCAEIRERCQSSGESSGVSISLGCATRTHSRVTIDDLIKIAEKRMYINKLRENQYARHFLLDLLMRSLREASVETQESSLPEG